MFQCSTTSLAPTPFAHSAILTHLFHVDHDELPTMLCFRSPFSNALSMFHPPATSDVAGHERAYTEGVEHSMQHSFSRSRSKTSSPAKLAVHPKNGRPGPLDRRAILTLLKEYRLDNEAVDRLKKTDWEVRRSEHAAHCNARGHLH